MGSGTRPVQTKLLLYLMKRSETRPVMKMVMISGRGDGGGKEFL